MENVMDAASAFFAKQDVLERLSTCTNETPSSLRKAVDRVVPASVAGLATRAATEATAGDLLGTLHSATYPQVNAVNVGRLCADASTVSDVAGSSQELVRRVFGGNLDPVLETVSAESGIRPTSARTLLGLVVPAVLGVLGRLSASRNLDARGLSQLLSDQGSKAASVLPARLANLVSPAGASADLTAQTLGEGSLLEAERRAALDERRGPARAYERAGTRRSRAPEQHDRRRAWILPILLLVGLLLALLLTRGFRVERPDVERAPEPRSHPASTADTASPHGFRESIAQHVPEDGARGVDGRIPVLAP